MIDGITIFAWFVMAVLFLVAVALVVFLGSLPKKIALKRNHPQVAAINAASWIGLALAGTGWPIAFIWAFLKSGPVGHNSSSEDGSSDGSPGSVDEISQLRARIKDLESKLNKSRAQNQ